MFVQIVINSIATNGIQITQDELQFPTLLLTILVMLILFSYLSFYI